MVHESENTRSDPNATRLLDQVRNAMRLRHMSRRTETAYVHWIVDFLRFHKQIAGHWQHPLTLGNSEINQYLTWLAVNRNVAASTQNQALSALLFLYTRVLERDINFDAMRAQRPVRVPVVLSVPEVLALLNAIPAGKHRIMAGLLYGAGLRLMEGCRIRIKDLDFDRRQLTVRDGKGEKDRMVPLPARLATHLKKQQELVHRQHVRDVQIGAGWVWMPYAFDRKDPTAARSFAWQYLFQADKLSTDRRPREADGTLVDQSDQLRRHHVHENAVQKAVKRATI